MASMASKKTLNRSFIRSLSSLRNRFHSNPNFPTIPPNPGDTHVFRPFFSKRAAFGSPEMSPATTGLFSIRENVMDRLKSIGIAKDGCRLDGLSSPLPNSVAAVTARSGSEESEGLTVEDVRKLLKAAKLETVKSRVRSVEKSWIGYPEFIRICSEGYSDPDQGLEFAKMLDESGDVFVFGKVVFLRPDQVTKTVEELIARTEMNPERKKELEEMENRKSAIDAKAEALVRRELWCGLAYFAVQTAAFMRLTFWELSWDVMEPICFYITSTYFVAAYVFFLRTSIEPSFQGFFQSRFVAKQKRLMKLHNFDVVKYNELRRSNCHFRPSSSSSLLFDNSENALHKKETEQSIVVQIVFSISDVQLFPVKRVIFQHGPSPNLLALFPRQNDYNVSIHRFIKLS